MRQRSADVARTNTNTGRKECEAQRAIAHPGRSPDLNHLAISATNHCLTGCAIGELTGMLIAISLGWSDVASIALAVGLAYLFGLSLTARPLVNAGLAAGVVISTALAADTVSITIMEAIDNAFVVFIPGATEAGIDDPLITRASPGGSWWPIPSLSSPTAT